MPGPSSSTGGGDTAIPKISTAIFPQLPVDSDDTP
jgi:hypothetical protein